MTRLKWLRPKLVVQVSFAEWTSYGLLRHATFEGVREDKEPQEVVREQSVADKPGIACPSVGGQSTT